MSVTASAQMVQLLPAGREGSMKKVTLHRFYNEHNIPQFGCGVRSVLALTPGRKWVTLIDPFTLDQANVLLSEWQRLKPQAVEARRHVIFDAMKTRAKYFVNEKGQSTLTNAAKEAFALVRHA
jgi:hypothetical protein